MARPRRVSPTRDAAIAARLSENDLLTLAPTNPRGSSLFESLRCLTDTPARWLSFDDIKDAIEPPNHTAPEVSDRVMQIHFVSLNGQEVEGRLAPSVPGIQASAIERHQRRSGLVPPDLALMTYLAK